jgi:hypothetical protein
MLVGVWDLSTSFLNATRIKSSGDGAERNKLQMKHTSLLIAGLILIQLCSAQDLKKIDWSSDVDFLAQELPKKHYDFFTVKGKNEFLTGLKKIRSTSIDLTDLDMAIRLQQLIAGFGDSHTRINYGQLIDRNKILPLHLAWFKDGLFILRTTHENNQILGHQILSVNGTPLKTITDSLATLITVDNEAIVKVEVPRLFSLTEILAHFGFAREPEVELMLKDLKGVIKPYRIKPAQLSRGNAETYKSDSLALCFKNETIFFIDYYLATDKVYYLQYNKCSGKEVELQYGSAKNAEKLPSFKEFEDKVFQTLKNASVEKIVFDMRFNAGGNSTQGTAFIEKLAGYLEKNPETKLYVIVGRNTFSSAILNAMDFKRLTKAVFVGEETAGKPNHFGEVRSFQLPNSGIKVNYSTKYFKRTDETANTIMPDIKLEPSFLEYSKGIDPAYGWIKKQ